MIYIDPPYNTGSDFVYHDDFKVGQNEYDEKAGNVDEEGNRLVSRGDNDLDDVFLKNTDTNGRFHSDWCSMIYSRLMIARSLLTEDGVIFISIDDNEVENLRKICDEVFGEGNFIADLIWSNKEGGGSSDSRLFRIKHEHILCFSKQIDLVNILGNPISNADRYKGKDEYVKERGPYYLQKLGMGSIQYSESLDYPIEAPDGTEIYPADNNGGKKACWRWSKDKFIRNKERGFTVIKKDNSNIWTVYTKQYMNCDNEGNAIKRTQRPMGIIDTFSSTQAAKYLESIGLACFNYSKPKELIKYLLEKVELEDSLILDFFSGSATTAHAVMQLNAEDGGNRRFIMVQLPEETAEDSEAYKAGYKNICEIGKERIRRAGKKIKEELLAKQGNGQSAKEQSSNGNEQGGLFDNTAHTNDSEDTNNANIGNVAINSLDTGFRVFRIDSGNMKDDLEQAPAEVDQLKLDFYLDNVKDDRTELDLLFGCMLNWGVQLSLPMSMETVDGCNIYTVNDGDLVACLTKDKPVTENIVRAIAEKSPLRVLFRDGSFASDASKINIFEQFKQLMDWSDDEIVKNVKVL